MKKSVNNILAYSLGICSLLLFIFTTPAITNAQTPPIDGTFVTLGAPFFPASMVPAYFREIKDLKFNTLILERTKERVGPCSSFTIQKSFSDFYPTLDAFMDEARINNIDVYLGLIFHAHGDQHCKGGFFWQDTQAVNRTMEEIRILAQELYNRYKNNPNLKGWYIPDEPNIFWFYTNQTMMNNLYRYYQTVHQDLKAIDSNLNTVVSPSFGGANIRGTRTNGLSVAEVESEIVKLRDRIGVDIYAWQDTVGGVSFAGMQQPFEEYLAILPRVFPKNKLWINNELFNYQANFTGLRGGSSMARIQRQFELTPKSLYSKRVVWNQTHHMSTTWGWRHPESERLLRTYQATYNLRGEIIQPLSYTWLTPPNSTYPDSNNKLTNKIPGMPFVQGKGFGNEWVGIETPNQTAKLTVQLPTTQIVDWITFHSIQHPPSSVYFPKKMTINCNKQSRIAHTRVVDFTTQNYLTNNTVQGEYAFSNFHPLAMACDSLEITIEGKNWIFLSEMEIVGGCGNIDLNNDNQISSAEILQATKVLGARCKKYQQQSICGTIDSNEDGVITNDDILNFLKRYMNRSRCGR